MTVKLPPQCERERTWTARAMDTAANKPSAASDSRACAAAAGQKQSRNDDRAIQRPIYPIRAAVGSFRDRIPCSEHFVDIDAQTGAMGAVI